MRDFGQRQSEKSDVSQGNQSLFGKISFFGKLNKERAARFERLKNFGPDTTGESRTDSVLQTREQIISESLADHQGLNTLRDQIGSWKNEESTEPRVLAAEIAVDEEDNDLLDRLRNDIASFKEVKSSGEKIVGGDESEVLSGLRGDLSGLFGKSPAIASGMGNETNSQLGDLRGDEPYLKDEQVSVEAIVESEPAQKPSISQSDVRDLKGEQSFKVSNFRAKRREFVAERPRDYVPHVSEEIGSSTIEQGEVLNLLGELKGEISALKEGQANPSNEGVSEFHALLSELKEDIAALKEEKKQPSLPETSEILNLFTELKADISALRKDQEVSTPPADSEVVELLAELKTEIRELKAEQSQNSMTSDSAILEMFIELQDEFSGLKKLHVESLHRPSNGDINEIPLLLRSLKDEIEVLKDEQMKSVELAYSSQFQDIHGLLQEMKSEVVGLNDEQVKMRDLLAEPAPQPNPSSERINTLLSQLKSEIDTAQSEFGGESGLQGPVAGATDMETLSTVNSVLSLLIGDNGASLDAQVEDLDDNVKTIAAG